MSKITQSLLGLWFIEYLDIKIIMIDIHLSDDGWRTYFFVAIWENFHHESPLNDFQNSFGASFVPTILVAEEWKIWLFIEEFDFLY